MIKTKVINQQNSKHFVVKFWLYFSFVWLVLTLFSTAEKLLNYSAQGVQYPVGVQIVWSLSNWFPWFLLSPLVFYLTRKISFDNKHTFKIIIFFLFIGVPFSVIKIIMYYVMSLPVRTDLTPSFFYTSIGDVIYSNFLGNYLVFALLVLTFYSIHYYRDSRKKELRTYQLETQLAKAQLQVLKMQLQPHFLFNTLNSISALLHQDAEQADTMITRLSDLLRITLDSTEEQLVFLKQEVSFLETYLEIEKIRFQERLQVKFDIAPETRTLLVPSLILQPIVENAIKYGVAPYSKVGFIAIQSRLDDDILELIVKDNGPGLGDRVPTALNRGIGLRNTKERLEQLYGVQQTLKFNNLPTGGLEVKIRIPSKISKKEFM